MSCNYSTSVRRLRIILKYGSVYIPPITQSKMHRPYSIHFVCH